MTIWRHWCKSCGKRVGPHDGGACTADECQSACRAVTRKQGRDEKLHAPCEREFILQRIDHNLPAMTASKPGEQILRDRLTRLRAVVLKEKYDRVPLALWTEFCDALQGKPETALREHAAALYAKKDAEDTSKRFRDAVKKGLAAAAVAAEREVVDAVLRGEAEGNDRSLPKPDWSPDAGIWKFAVGDAVLVGGVAGVIENRHHFDTNQEGYTVGYESATTKWSRWHPVTDISPAPKKLAEFKAGDRIITKFTKSKGTVLELLQLGVDSGSNRYTVKFDRNGLNRQRREDQIERLPVDAFTMGPGAKVRANKGGRLGTIQCENRNTTKVPGRVFSVVFEGSPTWLTYHEDDLSPWSAT